jgi:hypothetical protein
VTYALGPCHSQTKEYTVAPQRSLRWPPWRLQQERLWVALYLIYPNTRRLAPSPSNAAQPGMAVKEVLLG